MKEQWVVSFGSPFDGIELVGPFDDNDWALNYAETHDDQRDWHIVLLAEPEKEAGE